MRRTLFASSVAACLAATLLFAIPASPSRASTAVSSTQYVSLHVARHHATYGTDVQLRGLARSGGQRHLHRATVAIWFQPVSSKRWLRLKTVETSQRGHFRTKFKARRSGRIRALAANGSVSSASRIRVRSRLSIKPVRKLTKVGEQVLIRGMARPAGRRTVKVVIRGAEHAMLQARTKRHGGFAIKWRPKNAGRHSVRVFARGNDAATSDSSRRIRVTGLRPAYASYFGPGLYGNGMACGGRLYPDTRGVANKTLPCGTRVTLRYKGRTVITKVVDRGPYVAGRDFDLTTATRNDLGFGGVGTVWASR